MTDQLTTTNLIPEALGSEYGDTYWLQGHVEPAMAVLATMLDVMINVDAASAMACLTGEDRCTGTNWSQLREAASDTVRNVKHLWLTEDPNNEENMLPASEGDPGAEAWTCVDLKS